MAQLFIGIFVYLFCGVLTYLGLKMKLQKDAKEYFDDEEMEVEIEFDTKILIILMWFRLYKMTFIDNENVMAIIEFCKKFKQDEDEENDW